MNFDLEFRQDMYKYATESIIEVYGYDYNEALKLVENSKSLKHSLNYAPDMVAHYSEEQLADLVLDYV